MTRTKEYRFAVAAAFVLLAAFTAIRASAIGSGFPMAGAAALLLLAGLAAVTAVQKRRWVVVENIVWAILVVGATLAVFLPRV